ncbi:MAG: class I SAM-dependent methyltransferase [Campylobacterales bacterium]|nr:class I SAM-dependent methyltransferase [Campylobacterales bacterium]
MQSLDLYAKVEDLLGLEEASTDLRGYYIDTLKELSFDSLLDIGCGKGEFLLDIKKQLNPKRLLGADLSPLMVKATLDKGIEAHNIDICHLDGSFEIITAMFDMLNYLDAMGLQRFLACVEKLLAPNGIFLADINTLEGFESVAVGSYILDDGSRFLTIDSDFEEGIYSSEFTLFSQEDSNCFTKEQATIEQYYHSVESIQKVTNLKLIDQLDIYLYQEVQDKTLLMFKK